MADLLKLAGRIAEITPSWFPIAGHVRNVTFTLDEADAVIEALNHAAGATNALAVRPAQHPTAKPVAWRRRRKGTVGNDGWIMCPLKPERDHEFDLEPLYNVAPTAPLTPAECSDQHACGAKAMRLEACDAEIERMRAFMKELSDALLKVRPLGGSEMFVKRFGQYYADPDYCAQLIEQLNVDYIQSVKDRVRSKKEADQALALVESAQTALLAAKAYAEADFEDTSDLPAKVRASKLCDAVDAALKHSSTVRSPE